MGGTLGIGGSGAKTDRGQNLASTQGAWNIFNAGLPNGTAMEGAGTQSLEQAKKTLQAPEQYWKSLVEGGRTQYAQQAAPQINATIAGADATRRQAEQFGSGRSGATVAQQRDAATGTQANIDQVLNENIVRGRETGAKGLESVAGAKASIGDVQLRNALQSMGLSETAIEDIMKNSANNYQFDTQQSEKLGGALGGIAGQLAPVVAGWFGL